jgi:hypothetical protein
LGFPSATLSKPASLSTWNVTNPPCRSWYIMQKAKSAWRPT